MATTTRQIGPADHGQRMSFEDFLNADFEDGWLYELARGVVVATEVPGPDHGRIVRRLTRLFIASEDRYPGVITFGAGGSDVASGATYRTHLLPGLEARPDEWFDPLENA